MGKSLWVFASSVRKYGCLVDREEGFWNPVYPIYYRLVWLVWLVWGEEKRKDYKAFLLPVSPILLSFFSSDSLG